MVGRAFISSRAQQAMLALGAASGIAAVLLLVFSRSGRAPSAGPMTAVDFGYVGIQKCPTCHQEITASFLQTGMGRSFGRMTPETVIEDFHNNAYRWEHRGREYEMTRDGAEFFMARNRIDADVLGKRLPERKDRITHWIGSGKLMRGYASLKGNEYRRLHMAWYGQTGEWAPFAMQEYDFVLNDGLGYNCLFCHASYPKNVIGLSSVRELMFYAEAQDVGAIDCERCHGPGQRHVQSALNSLSPDAVRETMVNPARLSPELQMDICAQCHLEPTTRFPEHRLIAAGKSPYSFRPGERLQDHFRVIDYADPAMHDAQDTDIVNQTYLLTQSACFQKSGGRMTCSTCHNPHRTPPHSERMAYYRSKCLTCHADRDCTSPEMDPHSIESSDCVSCHMAPVHPIDAVRTVVHRHKIERRPISNLGTSLEARLNRTYRLYAPEYSRGPLKLYYGHENLSDQERFGYLALAYLANDQLVKGLMLLPPGFDDVRIAAPSDCVNLGRAYLARSDYPETTRWFRQVLARVPADYAVIEYMGIVELERGNPRQALALFRQVMDRAPQSASALFNLGRAHLALEEEDRAREAFDRLVAIDPLDCTPWLALGDFLDRAGRTQEALGQYRQAILVNPKDARGYLSMGQTLAGLSRFIEAAACYEAALNQGVQNTHIYLNLARCYDRTGLRIKAIALLERRLQQSPQDAALQTLYQQLRDRGNLPRSPSGE